MNVAGHYLSRSLLQVQKHAPLILTAVGVTMGAASTVMAARAGMNHKEAVMDANQNIQNIKNDHDNFGAAQYPVEVYQKDMAEAWLRKGKILLKLYGPSISMAVGGISLVLAGHGILSQRNAALTVAYNALESSYQKYRDRVKDKLGEKVEEKLAYDIRTEEVEVPGEKGSKKKTVETVGPNGVSPYARFFDETNPNWERNAENNLYFLQCQQNYLNLRFQSRGHLFLNEVYDALGIERSGPGAVVGWVLDGEGDNFVDFGIYEALNPQKRRFVNGDEQSILLDFNVDGTIFDKI